jgi:hypothetical protein
MRLLSGNKRGMFCRICAEMIFKFAYLLTNTGARSPPHRNVCNGMPQKPDYFRKSANGEYESDWAAYSGRSFSAGDNISDAV